MGVSPRFRKFPLAIRIKHSNFSVVCHYACRVIIFIRPHISWERIRRFYSCHSQTPSTLCMINQMMGTFSKNASHLLSLFCIQLSVLSVHSLRFLTFFFSKTENTVQYNSPGIDIEGLVTFPILQRCMSFTFCTASSFARIVLGMAVLKLTIAVRTM